MKAIAANLLKRRWSQLELAASGAFWDGNRKQYVVSLRFAGGAHMDATLHIELTALEMQAVLKAEETRARLQASTKLGA